MKNFITSILRIFLLYLFFRYLIFVCLIWAILEIITQSIKYKKVNILVKFICNFITSILTSLNYLINILLSIPANRIIITTEGDKFGNPRKKFTSTLKINIIKGTIKPRGLILFKIIESISNFGKHE